MSEFTAGVLTGIAGTICTSLALVGAMAAVLMRQRPEPLPSVPPSARRWSGSWRPWGSAGQPTRCAGRAAARRGH